MREPVTVACAQVEPVVLDRERTLDKISEVAAEAAAQGARLVVFPEAFVPAYPSSRWARFLAGGADAKPVFARLAREAVGIPGPSSDRLGAIAREQSVWLAVGVNELDGGTIYNSLLLYSDEGALALHHRKLVPTNHERLVWGQGDGGGLRAIETSLGRIGGLICWENQMPLADGPELVGRGGSAILGPDGSYLAGPLWDEEGLLVAELDPERLYEERQRFDPAGHYHRPDVLSLRVRAPRAKRLA